MISFRAFLAVLCILICNLCTSSGWFGFVFFGILDKNLFMGNKSERGSFTRNYLKKKNQKVSLKTHSGSQYFRWKLFFPVSR